MTKPIIRIHNTETDEVIDREMTDDEYAVYLEEQELSKQHKIKYQASVKAKEALLAKLGITADEAQLLLS